ncbi:MAG: GNAT family N-acetyltransferase [Actinobacteria bacterium 13_2_20CM_2_72_6]|nr:MAG: GNAT family N-acetyltransferase [Actinobacteria bacterium 13_2_20CM_2_72_6]
MGQVTVRRVRPEDAARVKAIRLEMLVDSPLAFLERIDEAAAKPHAQYQARIALVATDPDSAQFIAEEDGRIIGHAGGWAPSGTGGITLIFAVYVTPARRGTGVLKQLVDVVAEWSRAMGRPRLELEVIVGNDRAVRAYQRIGFSDTGKRAPHPTIPVLTEMVMTRPV